MYTRKIIEVSFTLSPKECYYHPNDHKRLVSEIFLRQYKDKCVARCYVLDVVEVLTTSLIYMIESDLEGRGRIDAVVLVECIVYELKMLIANAKLINITGTLLSFESDYATINTPIFSTDMALGPSLPIGTIVPIEVIETCYDTIYDDLYKRPLSCICSIYDPAKRNEEIIVRVGPLSKENIAYLKKISIYYADKLESLKREFVNKKNEKLLTQMREAMYLYNKRPKVLFRRPNVTVLSVHDILLFDQFPSGESIFVSKPDTIQQESSDFVRVQIPKDDTNFIDRDAKDFIEMYLMEYYMYNMATIEMLKTYTAQSSKEDIWKYYKSIKIN